MTFLFAKEFLLKTLGIADASKTFKPSLKKFSGTVCNFFLITTNVKKLGMSLLGDHRQTIKSFIHSQITQI